MAASSKIEWTDHTWNPWIGCTQVSPACDRCYAMVMMDQRYGRVEWGSGKPRSRTATATQRLPFRLQKAAAAVGKIETVFCLSLGDIWDKEIDPEWRQSAFATMRQTPNLIYLLLSKRIGKAVSMATAHGGLPPNCALGATMVTQVEWDRDMPKLERAGKALGALFTFASVEPMLEQIRPKGLFPGWVICGGESGAAPRHMAPDWARYLRDECAMADVPFFMKQMSGKVEIPDDLLVRQFPKEICDGR